MLLVIVIVIALCIYGGITRSHDRIRDEIRKQGERDQKPWTPLDELPH